MEYGTLLLFAQEANLAEAPDFLTRVALEFKQLLTVWGDPKYWPLMVLFFLEFAIWGAWIVVLGNYLNAKGFSRPIIGRIYGTMPLGAIFSPLIVATVADKYFNTEIVIGASHLIGAVLLVVMAQMKRPATFFWVTLLYALVYSPTLSLVNAVAFTHLPNQNTFPYIRVFGTVGWIAAGLSLKLLLKPDRPVDNKPLLLAGGLSLVLGIYTLLQVPETVPQVDPDAGMLPMVKALSIMADPGAAIFFGVTLIVSMAMGIYFAFAALFIEQQSGVRSQNVGPIMTLGQAVEVFFMLALPLVINDLGIQAVLLLGVAAWSLRFGFFSVAGRGKYFPLVLLGVALHGLCFDFFFAAGFIHVENLADESIRASGQALYGVVVYGLGMYLGTELAGWLNQRYTTEVAPAVAGEPPVRTTDWRKFWLIPFVAVTLAMLAFIASMYLVPEPAQPEIDPDAEPAAVVEGEVESDVIAVEPAPAETEVDVEPAEAAPAEGDETP
ncbi:MFS transporter [Tautonia sp. JC769]|uniref:MFS transporter n=1 Tax=Tautonia sp. JC769 TaxID=3232135 RepID=UPI003459868C